MPEGQIQALQNQITEHTSRDSSATETKLTALQLSRFRKELPAIEERWIQVKTLADTTGGTLSRKEKSCWKLMCR